MQTYHFDDLPPSAQDAAYAEYHEDAVNEVINERADEINADALNLIRSWRYDVLGKRIA